ncbi:MAG TPA: cobalamin-independent methionine synthase II family protein [Solirubrobacteraceae bacterium]|nr:cobalamin-independent methionine synthase II family protein [Solirubrobacteraceae bacterium]
MAYSYKFHADHIGSLIRPQSLLEARRRVEAGMIEPEELHEVENEEIGKVVRMQKDAGLDLFTDGEFRRDDFRSGFVDAVDGFTSEIVEMPWQSPEGKVMIPSTQYWVNERLRQRRRIAEGEVEYLRSLTKTGHIKVTLISPGFLAERSWREGVTDKVYESREELGAEIAEITRKEIEALFAEGAMYVQLDNPGYSAFVGSHVRLDGNGGSDAQAGFERTLAADIAAVEGVERPDGASIGMHICRGNRSSMWLAEGGYDAIAERVFSSLPVDRFLLEFDDERAGGFEPLRHVPDDKVVVLGLISTKTSQLESVEALVRRIDEAASIVEIDNLAVSPQCGFASVADGANKLSADDEFKKLRLVYDTAIAAWGFEG